MPDAQSAGDSPGLTPLAKAADRIRASAQYLLAAFAAVGATLAAGLQLGNLGEVTVDDPLRLVAAFGGIIGAVVGIAIAIAAVATVSTASYVDLSWLLANQKSDAWRAIDGDPGLRQGLTIEDLRTQLNDAAHAANTTYRTVVEYGDPGTESQRVAEAGRLRTAFDQANARLLQLKVIRADVLDVASYVRTRSAFESAKKYIVSGALVAALGISAFAWGANAPKHPTIDPGEILPKTPSNVTVVLSRAGVAKYRKSLGKSCNPSSIDGIAFAVTGSTYTVTTLRTKKCRSITLTVSPRLGQVIPRLKSPS